MISKKTAIICSIIVLSLSACSDVKPSTERTTVDGYAATVENVTTTTSAMPAITTTSPKETTTTESSTTTTIETTTTTEAPTSTITTTTTSKAPETTTAGHRYYILNHNSGILHSPTCYTLEDSSPDYEDVIDVSQEWLDANGYRTCKKCNPFVPSNSNSVTTANQPLTTTTTTTTTQGTTTTTMTTTTQGTTTTTAKETQAVANVPTLSVIDVETIAPETYSLTENNYFVPPAEPFENNETAQSVTEPSVIILPIIPVD